MSREEFKGLIIDILNDDSCYQWQDKFKKVMNEYDRLQADNAELKKAKAKLDKEVEEWYEIVEEWDDTGDGCWLRQKLLDRKLQSDE